MPVQLHAPASFEAIAMPAAPGEMLFLEGDPCDHICEMRQGIARGVILSVDGERQVVAFFFAGDHIGQPMAETFRFTAEAVTQVRYIRHSLARWHEALVHGCREEGRLPRSIWSEQDSIFRRGIILGRNGVLVRICAFLLSVIDRLDRVEGALDFPLPQIDIAAYLATAPETLCRGFRQLREMGVISMPRRDRLIIRNRYRLEAIASGAADRREGAWA